VVVYDSVTEKLAEGVTDMLNVCETVWDPLSVKVPVSVTLCDWESVRLRDKLSGTVAVSEREWVSDSVAVGVGGGVTVIDNDVEYVVDTENVCELEIVML
jgi:hypothetical protein